LAELCRSDAVLTMVADDAALDSIVFGEGRLLVSLTPQVPHFSLSTISVALSERLAKEHAKRGQSFVAAPVFGRPQAAEAGQLTPVAAGPAGVSEEHRKMLAAIGSKLVVLGDRPALATTLKLLGNFLLASVIESLSEMLVLARRSGLDPAQVLEFF